MKTMQLRQELLTQLHRLCHPVPIVTCDRVARVGAVAHVSDADVLSSKSARMQACPLADRVVFCKVKEKMGGRVRLMISGGAPLARHVEEFMKVKPV